MMLRSTPSTLNRMSNPSRRLVLAGGLGLAATIALASCANEQPAALNLPEIRFQDKAPFRLKASAVKIVDDAAVAAGSPEWANIFPTLPRKAMRNWGQDRLVADPAAANIARYRISEASIEHSLGEKAKGMFKAARQEKFMIRVAGDLEIRQPDGILIRAVSGKSWGEQSVPVDAKPADRKLAIDSLVRRVMAGFDREMETAIRANMADLAF